MSIFLTTDDTFEISIKSSVDEAGALNFEIVDGGPYKFRTCTGREFGRVRTAISKGDHDSLFVLFKEFSKSGLTAKQIDTLHPDVVFVVLLEVLKRSRISEDDRGN